MMKNQTKYLVIHILGVIAGYLHNPPTFLIVGGITVFLILMFTDDVKHKTQ